MLVFMITAKLLFLKRFSGVLLFKLFHYTQMFIININNMLAILLYYWECSVRMSELQYANTNLVKEK